MALIKITPNDVETFTIVTTPSRFYSSSSSGVTGSVYVFPRLSNLEKDKDKTTVFNDSSKSALVDSSFDVSLKNVQDESRTFRSFGSSITGSIESYLSLVNSLNQKEKATLEIERFTPTVNFTKNNLIKNNIKDVLMPYYKAAYPHAHWAYTNYHSLNFFTSYDNGLQLVPTSSVLLYPNVSESENEGYTSGSYCFPGAFTFDFYINPRYKNDGIENGHFKAGTIFHLSSSYALSLVTGSKKDINGLPECFRLLLQLSHSADYPPSAVQPGGHPFDLTFLSDDNCLTYNNWHHVIVRWGTNLVNDGTGSFIVDGINKGNFVIPSGTILPTSFISSSNPDVLCIGNFYEGTNAGSNSLNGFFNEENSKRDGTIRLTDSGLEPTDYHFRHPLKAEIHDLVFRKKYLSDKQIKLTGSRGIGNDAFSEEVSFYLPPFFVEETPIRRYINGKGGILQTPFFSIDGTTDDPFNVAMSFGVNGHYINLENFCKDFATGRFPKLLCLSASTIDYTTEVLEANTFLYQDGAVAKRNLTILPCDDGLFDPNYEVLLSERLRNKFTDPYGVSDISYINLDNLVTSASLQAGGINVFDPDNTSLQDFSQELIGPSPEKPGLAPGSAYRNYINSVSSSLSQVTEDYNFDRGIQRGVPLTIYQRLLDPSSNQVTFFNISNLFYGKKISPGTFTISDSGISGSHNQVKITIKDDGFGNLYRANSDTTHFTQNSIGNIFYDEGIVVVKNPHLYFFGKNQYEISFKGIQNIYTTKYEVLASPGLLNSSSNITYNRNKDLLRPSSDIKDNETFVYIDGMYFHDENMNVVAKAKFAQPIIKREGNKILFKVTFDY